MRCDLRSLMRFRNLEVDILDRITRIQQEHSDLIRTELDVHEENGFSRFFRRGLTQRCRIVEWRTWILIGVIG